MVKSCFGVFFNSLLVIAAAYSSVATGAVITFDFTADIYSITRNANIVPISVGDRIDGFLTYDTVAAMPGSIFTANWRDYTFNTSALIQLNVGGQSIARSVTLIDAIDDYHPIAKYYLDRFFIASNGYNAQDNDWIQMWIDGADTTAPSPLLTSVDLPVSALNLLLADLGASPVALDSPDLAFSAFVSSLSQRTSSVSDPATSYLFGLAVLCIVATRKRKHEIVPISRN